MNITVKKTGKYRIYPVKSQITNLENQFSMCRHLYNWSLAERKESYEYDGSSISYHNQAVQLPSLKKERPWYKGVYSQVLQDVLKRLDKGYQSFFRRAKAGENPGFPKFKKRGQWNSITYPQYSKPLGSIIQIPKVGMVKMVYHRTVSTRAKIKI